MGVKIGALKSPYCCIALRIWSMVVAAAYIALATCIFNSLKPTDPPDWESNIEVENDDGEDIVGGFSGDDIPLNDDKNNEKHVPPETVIWRLILNHIEKMFPSHVTTVLGLCMFTFLVSLLLLIGAWKKVSQLMVMWLLLVGGFFVSITASTLATGIQIIYYDDSTDNFFTLVLFQLIDLVVLWTFVIVLSYYKELKFDNAVSELEEDVIIQVPPPAKLSRAPLSRRLSRVGQPPLPPPYSETDDRLATTAEYIRPSSHRTPPRTPLYIRPNPFVSQIGNMDIEEDEEAVEVEVIYTPIRKKKLSKEKSFNSTEM